MMRQSKGHRDNFQKHKKDFKRDGNPKGNPRSSEKRERFANKKKGSAKGSNLKKNVAIEKHPKFPGVFIGRGKSDTLLTLNAVPGASVYGEKRVVVPLQGKKIEYRSWNCYRSKLAASIACGLKDLSIRPGSVVLYLGAANGTTVSHVAEIVGEESLVYAVEFSQRSGRDLLSLSTKRANIVPIIADARAPSAYRMLVPMADVIFSDVSQSDQSRIVMENAKYFLKNEGSIMISVKASSVDSSLPAETVYANELNWLKRNGFVFREKVLLEPYEKNHAMLVGKFNMHQEGEK